MAPYADTAKYVSPRSRAKKNSTGPVIHGSPMMRPPNVGPNRRAARLMPATKSGVTVSLSSRSVFKGGANDSVVLEGHVRELNRQVTRQPPPSLRRRYASEVGACDEHLAIPRLRDEPSWRAPLV